METLLLPRQLALLTLQQFTSEGQYRGPHFQIWEPELWGGLISNNSLSHLLRALKLETASVGGEALHLGHTLYTSPEMCPTHFLSAQPIKWPSAEAERYKSSSALNVFSYKVTILELVTASVV